MTGELLVSYIARGLLVLCVLAAVGQHIKRRRERRELFNRLEQMQ